MVLQVNNRPMIENLRKYPVETVEKLRRLLAAGAHAQPDPRRKNFFEVQDGCEVFYIHLTPFSRKVMLLARWDKGCPETT